MCTYNIALDDELVAKMSVSLNGTDAITSWIQKLVVEHANKFVRELETTPSSATCDIDPAILQMFGGKQIVPSTIDDKELISNIREERYI